MVKVSIISPVYNVEEYIPRFLKSIKSQILTDYELILVDDGSTDNSLEVCRNLTEQDNNIHVIHQENQGSGAARNTGLKYAQGKYIYFCDPDDYLDKKLLSDNVSLAEKNNSDVIIFGYIAETIDGQILKKVVPQAGEYTSLQEMKKIFPVWFEKQLFYYVWNKLYLRDSIKDLKFERARTGQDFRFNIKYFRVTRRIFCNNRVYYHYLSNRPNSAQNSIQLNKMRNKALDLAEENQQLEELFFNYWGEKRNKIYTNLIRERKKNAILLALNSSESLSIRDRKSYLNNLLERNDIDQFINAQNHVGMKERYISFLLRHKDNAGILLCDKCVRKVWRHVK